MISKALFVSLLLVATQSLLGYALEGESWTLNRTVVMQLSLGGPRSLSDGFTSFNASAQDALNLWNQHLTHLQFTTVLASPVTPATGDDENSAFFSNTVFGDQFGTNVLAVTAYNFRGTTMEESDTVFNSAYTWDSYNGPLNVSVPDFHRVALHEFGHNLGLNHPDQAGQTVAAIMNSRIGNIDTLQPDDIAGVQFLYDTGPAYQSSVPAPVLANISTRAFIGAGDNVLIGGFIVQGTQPATVILRAIGFSLSAIGFTDAIMDPTITVYDSNQQQVAMNDDWAFTGADAETIGSYHLDPPNSRESALYLTLQPGAYTAVVQSFLDAENPPVPGIGLFELYDLHTTGGRAGNISTRGQVLGGDNVLIGGLIIGGTEIKTIIARAIGPSLGAAGVANPLADPTLELHDSNGNLLQSNDDWQAGPDAQAITSDGLAPTNPKESALLATLNPGAYTAIVRGVNGATGIGLVEVYDLSPVP
ncbi:MAG TPA: matrixin family metalloprotease [Chthoniobacterales bacterium]|nr:matrixin family metalloprotease [Chthoniobacterales bacterium]